MHSIDNERLGDSVAILKTSLEEKRVEFEAVRLSLGKEKVPALAKAEILKIQLAEEKFSREAALKEATKK